MRPFNLDEYLKDPSRKVVTRDGKSVRIICTDAKGICPVVGLVAYENFELVFSATKDGRIDGIFDFFFAPEKHEGWINLYKNAMGYVFPSYMYQTEEEAKKQTDKIGSYLTTVKIEWKE